MSAAGKAILLEAGLVVDGSGDPAWTGDLLLRGARIAALGVDLRARLPDGLTPSDVERVDCRARVIAPGFIDAHTHDDASVLHDPLCLPKLSQGITTVVTGNCGISLAPYRTPRAGPPLTLLGAQAFEYASMAAYRAAVDAARPALNVAALVGHTTLRYASMQALDREASADELARMQALLDGCMADGAHGMSSGLFYAEAFAAPAEEVTTLARVVARHGGVYATHLRSEMQQIVEALHEAGDCAFSAGVPLVISHHKCAGRANWGRTRETLALIEALAQRQRIALDAYPYVAGSTLLREDLVDGVIDVLLTWSDPHPGMAGRLLSDIARAWGCTEQQACLRLQPGGACYFQMHEEDVERVIAHPLSMIGSDGLPHDRHPHPRLWGTFPRVFARYWRERRLFTLEQAVHKMTGMTARNLRIAGRGLLRAGAMADVVVFDPESIADTATYEQPRGLSRGIDQVFVNGVLTYRGGDSAGVRARAGRMLVRGA
ncbi:N-acyl-D-amino-acid deacylase family protein [Verminephrobacter aporrectodeae]|uniref:D-aminoacylase n=1 Tax=Verminephrobacter aporrectodeae subsp. tuberculatae TaxID=1110392 RepID=A0ABT3KN16_9BURK|nr:D-aminoacylase [Verminephrobacter aporrectodeae]MCW5319706.1 D-aminoacylase [Verminephrobacter aporrectodeae subsp. tuberculatae]MCW8174749.1 D-aminoacylase [Verminephrobacter aporrectodeae subsp. tuberculatae]MCW8202280.1 D-aminoacylase [Verminephrobacter aporrectodeae subsp. tuberculatae]